MLTRACLSAKTHKPYINFCNELCTAVVVSYYLILKGLLCFSLIGAINIFSLLPRLSRSFNSSSGFSSYDPNSNEPLGNFNDNGTIISMTQGKLRQLIAEAFK